ncbi:hypothetical protein [Clostridium aminobutyricum]|uniref:Glycine-rich domain-containing protein n=1 Tax=Clostridium aminobutyricum TaxID=33953 RepID=A0A939IJ20_CLOAM|nr:hypothetical protein [Clostridium aminobutyricum]MBN7773158.1 hypothetical protein [Clostridium aminobutyricum]
MSTNTTNYNLIKPADNETADISVINVNMDKMDQVLKVIEQHAEDLDIQNVKLDGEQILTGVKIFPALVSNGDNNHLQFFRNFEKEWHIEALEDRLSIVQSGIGERLSINKDGNVNINGELNVPEPTQDSHAVNKQYVDENNYVHPINSGNKHIPSGGIVGQILQNIDDGTGTWQDLAALETTLSATTQTLFGVTNVDSALQKIGNSMFTYTVENITSSQAWAVPIGVTKIDIIGIGGGGGGGVVLSTYTNPGSSYTYTGAGGGGGNGGSAIVLNNIKVTSGNILTISIGSGGSAISAGGSSKSGGNTTIKFPNGATVTASGGLGGICTSGVGGSLYSGTNSPNAESSSNYPFTNNAGAAATYTTSGTVSPNFLVGFDFNSLITLSAGGSGAGTQCVNNSSYTLGTAQTASSGGGSGASAGVAVAHSATGYGCGGGGSCASTLPTSASAYIVTNPTSGAGKQGVVYIGYYKAV